MDSPESTRLVSVWLSDPPIEKGDQVLPDPNVPDGGFKSYHEFFSRPLTDQDKVRPQTMPDRDYIIAAPTDDLMNTIPSETFPNGRKFQTRGPEEAGKEKNGVPG